MRMQTRLFDHAILQSALRAGKWAGTLTRVRKNGQRFSARAVVTPRCDATGRAIGEGSTFTLVILAK